MSYPVGSQPFPGQQQQQQQYGAPQHQHQQPHPQHQMQHVQQSMQPQHQQMRYGQPPPQNSPHYGSYGQQCQQNIYSVNAWQALQFDSESEFVQTFEQYKSQTYGALQAEGLQQILNNTPRIRNYYRINWSLELCKIMLAMLDRSKDGMMQYEEFRELLQCLIYWYQTFCDYDTNRSGYMEAHELGKCIKERLGYSISAKAMETLLKRYSHATADRRLLIAFDDFVSCCVRLRAYTEAFRVRDKMSNQGRETGTTAFSYDDFLQCTMCL